MNPHDKVNDWLAAQGITVDNAPQRLHPNNYNGYQHFHVYKHCDPGDEAVTIDEMLVELASQLGTSKNIWWIDKPQMPQMVTDYCIETGTQRVHIALRGIHW